MSNYKMFRVFCATTLSEEAEREAFYEVIATVNESTAMPAGALLVPVSLVPRMANKLVYQSAIDENVRDSSVYIQVLADSWGPPERNFERDFSLACQCLKKDSSPMRNVVVLCKSPSLSIETPNSVTQIAYNSIADFREHVHNFLSEWVTCQTALQTA